MTTLKPSNRPIYLNNQFKGGKLDLLPGTHAAIALRYAKQEQCSLANKGGKVRIIEQHPQKASFVAASIENNVKIYGDGDENHFYGIETFGSWGLIFTGTGNLSVNRLSMDGNNNGFCGIMAKSDNVRSVEMGLVSIFDVKAKRFTGEGIYIGQSTSDTKRYHRISDVIIQNYIASEMWREAAQIRHADKLRIYGVMATKCGLRNKRDQNFNWQIVDSYGTMSNSIFVHDMASQPWNIHTTGFEFKNNVVVGNPKCPRLAYFGNNVELSKDNRINESDAYKPLVIDTLFALNFNEDRELFKVANGQVPVIIKELVTDKNYPVVEKATKDANIEIISHTVKEDLPMPKFSKSNPDLLDDECFYAKMGIGLDENYGNLDLDDISDPEPIIENDEMFTAEEQEYLQQKTKDSELENSILNKLTKLN